MFVFGSREFNIVIAERIGWGKGGGSVILGGMRNRISAGPDLSSSLLASR